VSLSERDRALAAIKGRSSLPPGSQFAWTYWRITNRLFPAVSWHEFREWELWQIAAVLGLDRIEASPEELALIERFNEEAQRLPSPDRKG